MSIFSTIKDVIFGSAEAKPAVTPAVVAALSPPTQDSSASELPTPDAKTKAAVTTLPIDVDATLAALAAINGQPLNYQTSIVDLLKLLGLDSSLSHRKELAKDLNYSGNEDDSAAMNIWLHAEVMTKLAAEGCLVPEDWKH
jgi:Domain of unknown function (DUF3597)